MSREYYELAVDVDELFRKLAEGVKAEWRRLAGEFVEMRKAESEELRRVSDKWIRRPNDFDIGESLAWVAAFADHYLSDAATGKRPSLLSFGARPVRRESILPDDPECPLAAEFLADALEEGDAGRNGRRFRPLAEQLEISRRFEAVQEWAESSESTGDRNELPPPPGAAPGPGTAVAHAGDATELWNSLTDRQRHTLRAMKEFAALDVESRRTAKKIAEWTEGSRARLGDFKLALADLRYRGLVDSQTGRTGGSWLTPDGAALLAACDSPGD